MRLFSIFLSLMLPVGVAAQAGGIVFSGRVLSREESAPLPSASVSLVRLPDSLRLGQLSDAEGRFRFSGLEAGSYLLRAEFAGYEPLREVLTISASPVQPQDFFLSRQAFQIATVTIEGEAPGAQQKGDTTEFSAAAYSTQPNATSEELLEKVPGVVVQNGQVTAQGERVQQVLVDGRPFFGNDPSAALRNLPAEVVDKIQVFDQQSEQSRMSGFDDGQTVRTINIVLKQDARDGTFGNAYAGYGSQDRYQAGGVVNRFSGARRFTLLAQSNNVNRQNFTSEDLAGVVSSSSGGSRGGMGMGMGMGMAMRGGGPGGFGGNSSSNFLVGEQSGIVSTQALGLNYSDELGAKVKLSGSYFFNLTDTDNEQITRRQYVSSESEGQLYQEEQISASQNLNHRFNLRLEYEIDSFTRLMLIPRLTLQQNTSETRTDAETQLRNLTLNGSGSLLNSEVNAWNASANLLLMRRFRKTGHSLMLRLQPQYSGSRGESSQESALRFFDGPGIRPDSINQYTRLSSRGLQLSGGLTYTLPLGLKGSMMNSLEFGPQRNEYEQLTYRFPGDNPLFDRLDTLLSSSFSSDYFSQQLGTGFSYRSGRKFLMLRASIQRATLDNEVLFPQESSISRVFWNVLPFAVYRHQFKAQKSLNIFYRSSTNLPTVSQLQTAINNNNPLQLSSGNPALTQNWRHDLNLRYNATNTAKGELFFALLSAQYTDNYIGNSTLIASRDTLLPGGIRLQRGAQLSSPVNLDGYWSLRSLLTLGREIKPLKTNVNLSLSGDYVRTPGLINNLLNISDNYTAGFSAVFASNISPAVDFTVSSRTQYNWVLNSLQSELNAQYLSQNTRAKLNLTVRKHLVLRSELSHQFYDGLSEGFDPSYWLWRAGIAARFLKEQRGELELSVFDLLRQNTSISRNITETYIEDLQTAVLQRYALLTFTYQLRNYK